MDAPDFIPIIAGPTGSGKTAVALELAQKFPLEIISADSRQIIKELNIGTAKPTIEEQAQVKFHLIDMVAPGEKYSAFRFIDDANRAIAETIKNNRFPLVVGGTGLYLRALTEGVVEIDAEDMAIRERLEAEYDQLGAEKLFERLEKVDPLEAVKIHPNNKIRLIRALEIFELTGKSKSELVTTGAYRKTNYNFEFYLLLPDRDELYQKINERVDMMLKFGLIEEIQALIDRGLGEAIAQSAVIGYTEILDYLNGNQSLETAVNMIKQNSRRYAKRQYTWFRNQSRGERFSDRAALIQKLEEAISTQNLI